MRRAGGGVCQKRAGLGRGHRPSGTRSCIWPFLISPLGQCNKGTHRICERGRLCEWESELTAAVPGARSWQPSPVDCSLVTREASEPHLTWAQIFIPFHLLPTFSLLFFPGGGIKCKKYLSCCYTIHIFNLTRKLVQLQGTFIFFCKMLLSSVNNKQALQAAPLAPQQAPPAWQPCPRPALSAHMPGTSS